MSRRRYRWDPEQGCCVEVGVEYTGQLRSEGRASEEEVYGHAVATDGTDLSTKRRHREYMRDNNLAMASDFTQTWAKAADERAAARDPKRGIDAAERREQIGRIAYGLKTGQIKPPARERYEE